MSTLRERFRDNLVGIVTLLILGAGFVALFADIENFYLIWILGFVVVVPLVAMLFDEDDENDHSPREFLHDIEDLGHDIGFSGHTRTRQWEHETSDQSSSSSTQDALTTLRERYASGDLTDEQFERKLDRLLETETPENAAEWRERSAREVETE